MSTIPSIVRVRQTFENVRVDDVPAEVCAQLASLNLGQRIKPGHSVAVTVGSRGINHIHEITKAIVTTLRGLGAEPFLVPAMGSHGGGTAAGQLQVLASYGVTEAYCGCPIRASMETIVIGQTPEGIDVHFDKHASQADHVLVANRIKPHTGFVGDIESGLMKMLLIGLGKHEGAKIYHRAIQNHSWEQIVHSAASMVLKSRPIVAGVAIVENGYDETARIVAVHPHEFAAREKELLVLAKRLLPRLPLEAIDLLVIDEVGKNISGTGMDTNVVGRKYYAHEAAEHETPKVQQILIRGLTEATQGNATGIGLAEFCTTRALAQVDIAKTRTNCLTAGHVAGAMMPLDYTTDRAAIDAALSTIGMTAPADAKVLWIRNTLELGELECSTPCLEHLRGLANVEILTEARPMPFDAAGNLPAEGVSSLASKPVARVR